MPRSSSLAVAEAHGVDAGAEQRNGSALARGLSILRCFSPQQPEMSARELMEKTGIPKPTLFRLLETLCELGMLRYSSRVSKYVVGVGMVNLAAPALARMTGRRLARPYMKDLADYIQGTLQMMVCAGRQNSYVEVVQGAGSQIFQAEIGTVASMSRTASGRAYLCTLPQAERDSYLAAMAQKDAARGEWLASRLADTRRELDEYGFCLGHRDMHREIETLAVPLSAPRGGEHIVFAASIAVFNPLIDRLVDDVGPRLVALARNVEVSMGSAE